MKLNLVEGFGLVMKTLPFVLLRGGLYLAFGVAAIIYYGMVISFAFLFKDSGLSSIIILVATFGLFVLAGLFKRYVLYLIKAAHIAVMSMYITGEELPAGVNQIEFGKSFVMGKFKQVSVLFIIDRLVDGTIKVFNGTILLIADTLRLPFMEGLVSIIKVIMNFSVGLVDEAVLSYVIIKKEDNFWKSAREGLVLYVQSWKGVLYNAAVLVLINIISFVVFFLIIYAPIALLFKQFIFVGFIVAAIFAYLLKQALIYPLAVAAILVTFHQEIKNKTPNPALEAQLEGVSAKFRELKQKALEPPA